MSAITPPRAVIDTAAGTGGLVHVSVFLARAFEQSAPPLAARPDLHKCSGAGLASCLTCTRQLAPTDPDQQWTAPHVEHGICTVLADVDRFLGLYTTAPLANVNVPEAK